MTKTYTQLTGLYLFSFVLTGCYTSPTAPVTEQENGDSSTQTESVASHSDQTESKDQSEVDQDSGSSPQKRQSFCEAISAEKLSGITGQTYQDSRQTANFENIKHCEHLSQDGKYSLSVLVAYGQTAEQRMQQNERYGKTTAQSGFGDKCFWQADLGMLYAKFGDRYLETRISKSHGAEADRIQWAKEIIQLVLKHY